MLIPLLLVCFGLLSTLQAVRPPPDGGYPGGNTAEGGSGALFSLTTGGNNTALGSQALYSLTYGDQNTATGSAALYRNLYGSNNTADGFEALKNNKADGNTAVGSFALLSVTNAGGNTGVGFGALSSTAEGANTAIGAYALNNINGFENIALGWGAGCNLTSGFNNIDIGNFGVDGDSSTIRIGNTSNMMGCGGAPAFPHVATYIAGIYNVNEGGIILPVYVNSNGRLGTQPPASSRRFKHEIKAMERASESILALQPVTFEYKSDKTKTPQFGLIAEQVAEVNPDLVVRDEKGEIYSVGYEAVNAMLLNEFLKAHRKVEEQGGELQKQAAMIAQQQKQIEALTAGLQKLTARLEVDTMRHVVLADP